jgi:hypothetical protein
MSNDNIVHAILHEDDDDSPVNDDQRKAKALDCEDRNMTDRFINMAPARRCKFALECRNRMYCSFYHGAAADLARQFCSCVDIECPKPHPDRRRRIKRGRIVCNNCGGEHLVTACPSIKCYKCERYGHLANVCGKVRRLS